MSWLVINFSMFWKIQFSPGKKQTHFPVFSFLLFHRNRKKKKFKKKKVFWETFFCPLFFFLLTKQEKRRLLGGKFLFSIFMFLFLSSRLLPLETKLIRTLRLNHIQQNYKTKKMFFFFIFFLMVSHMTHLCATCTKTNREETLLENKFICFDRWKNRPSILVILNCFLSMFLTWQLVAKCVLPAWSF